MAFFGAPLNNLPSCDERLTHAGGVARTACCDERLTHTGAVARTTQIGLICLLVSSLGATWGNPRPEPLDCTAQYSERLIRTGTVAQQC